jgi:hypothetical protein
MVKKKNFFGFVPEKYKFNLTLVFFVVVGVLDYFMIDYFFQKQLDLPDMELDRTKQSYNEYRIRQTQSILLLLTALLSLFLFATGVYCVFSNEKTIPTFTLCHIPLILKILPFFSFALLYSLKNTYFKKKKPSPFEFFLLLVINLPLAFMVGTSLIVFIIYPR